MSTLISRNVHAALPEAIRLITAQGVERETRNGKVLVMPEPMISVFLQPQERVMFWPERDANPFFHFYEGLWMLGGRNDVGSLTRFVRRMAQFSDDGLTFHGAYGHRWRRWFGMDQIMTIGRALHNDKECRRQVLGIWDPKADLVEQKGARDMPCNLSVTFQISPLGVLDMCIFNRSNDIIWGAYGANPVHFSMLQEFIASVAGVPMGSYYSFSANWHAYRDTLDPLEALGDKGFQPHRVVQWANPYEEGTVAPYPMVSTTPSIWLSDLQMFLDEEDRAIGYQDKFFRKVALPMLRTHNVYRQTPDRPDRYVAAMDAARGIAATDWRTAVMEWLERRLQKWKSQ